MWSFGNTLLGQTVSCFLWAASRLSYLGERSSEVLRKSFSPLPSCLLSCVYFSQYPPNGELARRPCFLIHREENITGWLLLSSRFGILFKKVASRDVLKSMWCGYMRNACMYIEKVVKNYDWSKQTPREKTSLMKFFLTTVDPCFIGVDPMFLTPAVQKLDNAIHWISHYPQNNTIIGFSHTYLLDSDLSCR